jgi:hypothetical protein
MEAHNTTKLDNDYGVSRIGTYLASFLIEKENRTENDRMGKAKRHPSSSCPASVL